VLNQLRTGLVSHDDTDRIHPAAWAGTISWRQVTAPTESLDSLREGTWTGVITAPGARTRTGCCRRSGVSRASGE
jgi:hypothetical protein